MSCEPAAEHHGGQGAPPSPRYDRRLGSGKASRGTGSRAQRAVPRDVWPADGQAAFTETGQSVIHVGPDQHAAPIASVAKVMTAYVVLRDHPLDDEIGRAHV